MARDSAYDILIDDHGYILARQEQLGRGGRAWRVESASSRVAQPTSSERQYGAQPTTISAPMVWRSAHLGYGAERQEIEGRYNYTVNMDARFKEQVLPGPQVNVLETEMNSEVVRFFEQDGQLFLIGGRYCKQIESDDSITLDKDFGPEANAMDAIVFDGNAYVGLGYQDPYWKRQGAVGIYGEAVYGTDIYGGASTWTQAEGLYMGYMSIVKQLLWASVSNHEVSNVAADPLVPDNWGARYEIGNPGRDITALADLADLLYVGKTEGLYGVDQEEGGVMLTPELRPYGGESNCKQMIAWHGSMWVPQIRGLLNYRNMGEQGFLVSPATPGEDAGEDNPVRGTITAMAGDNRWLYAALYNHEGDTYIMAGRETQGAEEGRFGRLIWHPLAKIPGRRCGAMHISGLWTNPRLFFGMNDDVGYIVLPRYTDNPLHDRNCRYSKTGSIYYPAHTWQAPTTQKVWATVEVEADNMFLERYLEVFFRVDGGRWRSLGKPNISPYHILTFPEDTVGKDIELRVDYELPDSITPITLRTLLVRGAERPRSVQLITAVIRASDNLPLRTGGTDSRSGAEILSELRELSNTVEPLDVIDPTGGKRRVLMLDPVEEREAEQQGDMEREILAVVHMVTFEYKETAEDWTFAVYGTSTYGGGHVFR